MYGKVKWEHIVLVTIPQGVTVVTFCAVVQTTLASSTRVEDTRLFAVYIAISVCKETILSEEELDVRVCVVIVPSKKS